MSAAFAVFLHDCCAGRRSRREVRPSNIRVFGWPEESLTRADTASAIVVFLS